MHLDIGEPVAAKVFLQARAQRGAGFEGLDPAFGADDGPGQHAVDADIGAYIENRVAGGEVAQQEAEPMVIDLGAAGRIQKREAAAELYFPAAGGRPGPPTPDRGHEGAPKLLRLGFPRLQQDAVRPH